MIKLYTVDHLTMQEIADRFAMTRQAIHKRFRLAGVKISDGERVDVVCQVCGQIFSRTRKIWRKNIRHFCSVGCYGVHMENPAFNPSRSGQRMARLIVSRYFDLQPDHVVHHHDCDESHNTIENLAVFACQSDHTSFHRGGKGQPIWDGAKQAK